MNVNEIKNGQIVRLKFGDRFENAKVLGLMGEYILNINTRVMKRPLVVEEKRINF